MEELRIMEFLESPDHHGSHRKLLPELEDSAQGTVDAIIVPTVRNPGFLATARALAAILECPLLTLHSGRYTSAASATAKATILKGVTHVAIDVSEKSALSLIEFETTRILPKLFARRKDTSLKRNLGLLIAYMTGWERIVFLDDDIVVPNPEDLRRAAGLLTTYNAVGLAIGGFEDNSVVCHAYRAIGGSQESFIGGGALAVELTRDHSFFPDIYNEDWFYLLDRTKGLQPLAVTGRALQQPYEPFQEQRARKEEVGDVLAEGIFWLLDQGRTLDAANSGHWDEFLRRRKRFIEYILERAPQAELSPPERGRMVIALKASLGRLTHIEADWCDRYVKAWISDRRSWEQHINNVTKVSSLDDALASLSCTGGGPFNYVVHETTEPQIQQASQSAATLMRAPVPDKPQLCLSGQQG
jgi:glycosyltransferase involved in cell wall biosynthesis